MSPVAKPAAISTASLPAALEGIGTRRRKTNRLLLLARGPRLGFGFLLERRDLGVRFLDGRAGALERLSDRARGVNYRSPVIQR